MSKEKYRERTRPENEYPRLKRGVPEQNPGGKGKIGSGQKYTPFWGPSESDCWSQTAEDPLIGYLCFLVK